MDLGQTKKKGMFFKFKGQSNSSRKNLSEKKGNTRKKTADPLITDL